jgi:hypothetical protein
MHDNSPPATPLCRLLGCRHPLLLAGMGGVSRAELVAAVSEAGAFGFLGMVREPPRPRRCCKGRSTCASPCACPSSACSGTWTRP